MTKAKADEVAPRSVEPEARHPHHDEIGAIGLERLVVEPELVEHPWRVVLDDHVAGRDEPAHQIEAAWVAEVDRQALLVGVERGEDRARAPRTVPPSAGTPPTRRAPSGRVADSRWMTSAPSSASTMARERTGPERRHVEDPQPCERAAPVDAAVGAAARGCAASATASMACSPRRGAGSGGRRRPDPSRKGGPRVGRAVRGFATNGLPLAEVLERRRFAPLAIGAFGIRKADARSSTSSTVCVGDPGVDGRRQRGAVEEQRRVLHPLGMSDHRAEVEPLLPGAAPETDETVAGRRRHRASARSACVRIGRPSWSLKVTG